MRSGPARKLLLNYRHKSGTPRNLISFLEITLGSAEESAMHTAVSKAITMSRSSPYPPATTVSIYQWMFLFTDWSKMYRSNSLWQ